MSIPLSNLIDVKAQVVYAGTSSNSMYALLIAENSLIPNGAIATFKREQLSSIGELFNYNTVYDLAEVYFSSFVRSAKAPDVIYITNRNTEDNYSFLLGGDISKVKNSYLATLRGTLSLIVDGNQINGSIDLTGVTSKSAAASIIGKALGINCEYLSNTGSFILYSKLKGTSSCITQCSGTLADNLALGSTAKVSLNKGKETLTCVLDNAKKTNHAFCSVIFDQELSSNEKLEAAEWGNDQDNNVNVILTDSNEYVLTSGTGEALSDQVSSLNGVTLVYDDLLLCAFIACIAPSWDLSATNGRWDFAYRQSVKLTPKVFDEETANILYAKKYNFYGEWASGTEEFKYLQKGTMYGDYGYLDSWYCQIFMRRNLQYYLNNMFMKTPSIPYNEDGENSILAVLQDCTAQFKNFGAIRANVSIDQTLASELKTQGLTTTQISNLSTNGFLINVDMTSLSSADRKERKSPDVIYDYMDGGSLNTLKFYVTAVQ